MAHVDLHLSANAALVEERLAAGDLPEYPRPLDHMALFPRRATPEAIEALTAAGFTIGKVRSGLRRTQLYFSRTDTADLASANAVTQEVLAITTRLGGEYDGWAAFVITEPPAS
jgi:hypothetical protein